MVITELVTTLGFPAVVTLCLLMQQRSFLSGLDSAIKGITNDLERLSVRIDKLEQKIINQEDRNDFHRTN